MIVDAKRFHCAEVLFQPKTQELPDQSFFTVDAKRSRGWKCYSSQKAYELPDGNIITVGVKSFRVSTVMIFGKRAQIRQRLLNDHCRCVNTLIMG